MKNNKDYMRWGLTAFFVVLGGFASYYVIFHLDSLSLTLKKMFVVLMPVIDGFILAYLIAPLVNATERNITTPLFEFFKIGHKKGPKRFFIYYNYRSICIVGNICFFLNCNSSDF